MSLRTAIFWIHLPVGVTAAIVILMMAVTGVVLTYEAQLNQWALRGYRADPPAPDVAPLGLDELIARVTVDQSAGLVTSVALESDPREPAVVELDDGDPVHVDRFTGERLGDGNTRTRRFLRSVMYWHRWFALEGEYRIIGRTFTATANLGFLFLVVSGFYLWWPRTWTRHSLRNVTWFRRGLDGKARDFNWHNAIGFWTALPLLIIVFSGAMISYQWVGNLIYAAVGEPPPWRSARPAAAAAPPDDAAGSSPRPGAWASYQSILDRAAAESPGWRRLTVRIPDGADEAVTVQADRGSGRQPAKWTDLTFDRSSGILTARVSGLPDSRGEQIRYWLRFAHTGEVYGVVGQTIAGIASTGSAVLVWTGLAMTWRRFVRSRAVAAARRAASLPALPDWNASHQPRPVPIEAADGQARDTARADR